MFKFACISRNEEGQEEYRWPEERTDAIELCQGTIRVETDGEDVLIYGPPTLQVIQERETCLRLQQ